jgi:hypothetical protein
MLDFIDVLVRCDRLTIGDNGLLGGACEVGDEEAYRWIKFARTPFNFGDYPARLGATGGPVERLSFVDRRSVSKQPICLAGAPARSMALPSTVTVSWGRVRTGLCRSRPSSRR